MKKLILSVMMAFLLLPFGFSQNRVTFTENFNSSRHTFTCSPQVAWTSDTALVTSGKYAWGFVTSVEGDSVELISPIYDLKKYAYAYLRFTHICKVAEADLATVEYRENYVGSKWTPIPGECYQGGSTTYKRQTCFNHASYLAWKKFDALAEPERYWWQNETFDVSNCASYNEVQFKFKIKKGSKVGTNFTWGWLIDNFELIASAAKITPPAVQIIPPYIKGTVYNSGPFTIYAKAATRTNMAINTPIIRVSYTSKYGVVTTDSIRMTKYIGDSLWSGIIPQQNIGTQISYTVYAADKTGNNASASSAFEIGRTWQADSNCVAIYAIDTPSVGAMAGQKTKVYASLQNRGQNPLTSATIHWSINGVAQKDVKWKGNIEEGIVAKVKLGDYLPTGGKWDTLKVSVSLPNGIVRNPTADTLITKPVYACASVPTGTYTIAADGSASYKTITEVLDNIRSCGANGDIILSLRKGIYVENLDMTNFMDFIGLNNRLVLMSESGKAADVIIKADTLFDAALRMSRTRNIEIKNITFASNTNGIVISDTNYKLNIHNCRFILDSVSQEVCASISAENASVDGMIIDSNYMEGGYYGLSISGLSRARQAKNVTFTNNVIKSPFYGNKMVNTDFDYIRNNTITNRAVSPAPFYGLQMTDCAAELVANNRIHAWSSVPGGQGIYAANFNQDSNRTGAFINNEILYNASAMAYGIYVSISEASFYHNTVVMYGDGASRAVYCNNNTQGMSMHFYNNNFVCYNAGYPMYLNYDYYLGSDIVLDYNNYYGQTFLGYVGRLGDKTALTEWVKASNDQHSANVNPVFLDYTTSGKCVIYNGMYCPMMVEVPVDIADSVRNKQTAMGCYTSSAWKFDAALTQFIGWPTYVGYHSNTPVKVSLLNAGVDTIKSITLQWSVNGTLQTPYTWTGKLTSFEDTILTVGSYISEGGNNRISVWVGALNARTSDDCAEDDTLSNAVYGCSAPLKGDYYVGGDKADFTDIDEAFYVLNTCGVGGHVRLRLAAGHYPAMKLSGTTVAGLSDTATLMFTTVNDTDKVYIDGNPGLGIGNYSSAYAIGLDLGSAYFHFDNLIFNCTNTFAGISVIGTSANPVHHIKVSRCTFSMNPTGSGQQTGIYGTNGGANGRTNFEIYSNRFIGGYEGIEMYCGKGAGHRIDSNEFIDQYMYALNIQQLGLSSISYNTIKCRSAYAGGTYMGIMAYTLNCQHICNNYIDGSLYSGISQFRGIYVTLAQTLTSDTCRMYNNFIKGYSSNNLMSFYVANGRADICHNTVYAKCGNATQNANRFALQVYSNTAANSMCIKNNNLCAEGGTYAFYTPRNQAFLAIDNNNYYANSNVNLAYVSGNMKDIAAMQAFDTTATNVFPEFVDLAINGQIKQRPTLTCPRLDNIQTDILGVARPTTTYKGAYQGMVVKNNAAILSMNTPITTSALVGTKDTFSIIVENQGDNELKTLSLNWSINGVAQAPVQWNNTLKPAASTKIVLGTFNFVKGVNNVRVVTSQPNGQNDDYAANDTLAVELYGCAYAPLKGKYNVGGANAHYATLAEALTALEKCGIAGPVTMALAKASYPGMSLIGTYPGATDSSMVTFTSQSGNAADVVIGNAEAMSLTLNACNNLIFKNITIGNQVTTQTAVTLSGTITNVRFEHCNIYADTTSTSGAYGISQSGSCDRVYIVGNNIQGGVSNLNMTGGKPSFGIVIDSNTLTRACSYGMYGNSVYIRQFTHNYIRSRVAASANFTAIRWNSSVKFDTVACNRIYADNALGEVVGVYFGTSVREGACMIINNEFNLNTTTGSTCCGVMTNYSSGAGAVGSYFHLIHNTFYIAGRGRCNGLLYNTATAGTANTWVPSKPAIIEYNNFYVNGNANSTTLSYDDVKYATTPYTTTDYNNYYTPTAYIADLAGMKVSLVSDIANVSMQDAHSLSEQPILSDYPNSLHTNGKRIMVMTDTLMARTDLEGRLRQAGDYTNMGCYHDYMTNRYDVRMESIVYPTHYVATGKTQSIIVKIANIGTVRMDSVEIHCSANGKQLPVYMMKDTLEHGERSGDITIGSFMPQSGTNTLTVWVSNPNGVKDGNPDNDSAYTEILGCDSSLAGTYTVGTSKGANFVSIQAAIDALSYCGISGPVVFEVETGSYPAITISGQINGTTATNTITFISKERDKESVVIGTEEAPSLSLVNTKYLRFEHLTIGSTGSLNRVGVEMKALVEDVYFKHCNIQANTSASSSNSAAVYYNNNSTANYLKDVRFIGNEVRGGFAPFYLYQAGGDKKLCLPSANAASVIIDSNSILDGYYAGVYSMMANHIVSFSHNTLRPRANLSRAFYGLYIRYYNYIDSIVGNRIFLDNKGAAYPLYFTYYVNSTHTSNGFGTAAKPVLIANNDIVCANGVTTVQGVYVQYANLNMVNNSMRFTGTSNYGIYSVSATATDNFNVINNVLDCENGATNCLLVTNSTLMGYPTTHIEGNMYYASDTSKMFNCGGYKGFQTWRNAYPTFDTSSVFAAPIYKDVNTDLSIRTFIPEMVVNRDSSVLFDINGEKRTGLTTKGAYATPVFEGNDLALSAFVEPTQDEIPCVPNSTPVKLSVYNEGTHDVDFSKDPLTLHLKVVSDSVNLHKSIRIDSSMLSVMSTDTFEVLSMLDITYPGIYHLTAWLNWGKDEQNINDTLTFDYLVIKTVLPYENNFSDASVSGLSFNQMYGDITWEMTENNPVLNPVYGTGSLVFRSSESRGSISQALFSSVSLANSYRPQLYFWYAHDNANPNLRDQMDVRISQDGGATFKTLQTIYRYDAKCSTPTWKRYQVDLSKYTTGSCFVIAFTAYSYGGGDQTLDQVRIIAQQDMRVLVDSLHEKDFVACNMTGCKMTVYLENLTAQEVGFEAGDSITVEMSGASNFMYKKALSGRLENMEIDTMVLSPIDFVGGGRFDVKVYVNAVDSNRDNDTAKFSLNLNPDLAIVSSDAIGLSEPGDTIYAGITLKNTGNLDIVNPFNVSLLVNGKDTLTERIQTTLKVGDTLHYTFNQPFVVPAITSDQPYYLLDIFTSLSCDAHADNDSVQVIGAVNFVDYGILSITKPSATKCNLGGEEVAIEVRLFNNGTVDASDSMVLTAVIDSAGVVYKTIVEKIAPMYAGENRNHVFTQKYSVPRLSVNNAQETYHVTVYLAASKGDIDLSNDTATVETCVEGGVGVTEAASESWNMGQNVPNPASNVTVIPFTLPEAGVVTFNLMGMNGQVLYREEISAEAGQNSLQVNTSDYAAGIYYYSMEYQGQRIIKKMNVVR